MTMMEFQVECGKVLIDAALALENDRVKKAVINNDMEELRKALREEF